MALLGIDVASWQGESIDWQAVRNDGISFAIAKATEGTAYENPYFKDDWAAIKDAGIIRGSYHWAKPGLNSAPDEAYTFLRVIEKAGGLQPGDLIALDVEEGAGTNYGSWFLHWLQVVEANVGYKPLVYTGKWYLDQSDVDDMPGIEQYGLWLASYQSTMPPPPRPWPFIAIWQYSDKGQIAGIQGNVDLNTFNGDLDQLKAYGKPATIPPPTTQTRGITAEELRWLNDELLAVETNVTALRTEYERLLALANTPIQ